MNVIDFRLPALGADMESGTLTRWLKKTGDRVKRGDALAVVETAKGLIDIESFDDGTLEELVAQPGATVPVGAVLARIATAGAAAAATLPAREAVAIFPAAGPPASTPAVSAPATRRRVSPAARRRAHELGIDVARVEGTGPEGLVRIEDVDRCVEHAARAPQRAGMRATIGAAMARSKREIPHYYLAHAVDFGAARDWLAGFNAAVPVAERLMDAVLLVKSIALAVSEIDGFNGYFRDGQFQRSDAVHVGTAIALRGGGLVAPALLDANRKDLRTLMREFSDLVTRVRSGHMRSGELGSATITLTSLGADAVDVIFPVINPPQVAILGAGTIAERPCVIEGKLRARPVLTLTLAADHRVTDGRAGARLLRRVADLLARPENL
ncbi:MAG TPA: dihydrolipoamide acetyltransferase family protein [Steroidobacteraceae bacterium]|nr:dihydrolipoamide acetyltransferase family protein [Steroidobacteraceae bacterium]